MVLSGVQSKYKPAALNHSKQAGRLHRRQLLQLLHGAGARHALRLGWRHLLTSGRLRRLQGCRVSSGGVLGVHAGRLGCRRMRSWARRGKAAPVIDCPASLARKAVSAPISSTVAKRLFGCWARSTFFTTSSRGRSWARATPSTRRLVDVPIKVQVPPRIAA